MNKKAKPKRCKNCQEIIEEYHEKIEPGKCKLISFKEPKYPIPFSFQLKKLIRVASFGGGVNSVAGLLTEGLDKYDEIIFCDTGSEKTETYDYLAYLITIKKWNITVLNSKYGDIFSYYFKKRIYPTMFARDCTGKFKIDVAHKYLRTKYGKETIFHTDIFIDADEPDRERESKYKYERLNFPLIEKGIGRLECKEIIKSMNMPVPIKSGCYFCPFTPPSIWRKMKMAPEGSLDRIYFEEAQRLENNSRMRNKRKYPLIRLKGKDTQDLLTCACYSPNIDTKAAEKEMERIATEEELQWNKPY